MSVPLCHCCFGVFRELRAGFRKCVLLVPQGSVLSGLSFPVLLPAFCGHLVWRNFPGVPSKRDSTLCVAGTKPRVRLGEQERGYKLMKSSHSDPENLADRK